MREDQIYVSAKRWLKESGFTLIAGQPPNGCDSLPVVEIKDGGLTARGSKGSYKPDLIAGSGSAIVVVECKPYFDLQDVAKLESVLGSLERRRALYTEVVQRRLLVRRKLEASVPDFDSFSAKLRAVVAFSGDPSRCGMVGQLVLENDQGVGELVQPFEPAWRILL